MPPDVLDDAVDVLQELPPQPRLADPGRSDDRHETGAPLTAGRLEQVLQQPKLVVAADERRLDALAGSPAVSLADHAECAPGGDRARLALQRLVASGLEGDRQ